MAVEAPGRAPSPAGRAPGAASSRAGAGGADGDAMGGGTGSSGRNGPMASAGELRARHLHGRWGMLRAGRPRRRVEIRARWRPAGGTTTGARAAQGDAEVHMGPTCIGEPAGAPRTSCPRQCRGARGSHLYRGENTKGAHGDRWMEMDGEDRVLWALAIRVLQGHWLG
jgi:hypothetical protein